MPLKNSSPRSGWRRTAFLALFPFALCPAQTAPPDAPASVSGSVSGSVTNSLTGDPILRTHVLLRMAANGDVNPQTYGALTNREGKFTISPLPPGRYSVFADRLGFVMPANAGARPATFTLATGEKREDLKLTLTPTGAIIGHIFDTAGEPMPNVGVQVVGGAGNPGTNTDEHGRYRIGALRPGKYRVRATPRAENYGAEIRTDGSREVHYSATYYPGTPARASAQRLEVRPAAQLDGIDIRLVSTPIVSVSGKVSGLPAGLPAGHGRAGIQATPLAEGDFGGGQQGQVKPDGTFTISRLDPGKYLLVATSNGQGPARNLESAPVEIEIAGTDVEHIELRMIPPFEVSGQVRFDDEQVRFPQSPPRPPGQTSAPPPPVPVRQIHLEAVAGFMGRAFSAEIAADDSFTLENVHAGRYHAALSWGPGYVKSVRAGSSETEGDILDVGSGPAGAITVTVSSLTCDISGTVNGPSGTAAGINVIIVSESESAGRRFIRLSPAKPDGTYSFTGLPPGKYKLMATDDDSYPGATLEDDALVETVDLRPGDKITKDLKQK